MISLSPAKSILFFLYLYNFLSAGNAQNVKPDERIGLRGSADLRSRQLNDCVIPGGLGWYFCSNNNCPDDYTCMQRKDTWIGFDCHKKDCVQSRFSNFDHFDNFLPPIPLTQGFLDDPDLCWQGTCLTDDECKAGNKCFVKNSACACRSTMFSPDCEEILVGGYWQDIPCTESIGEVETEPEYSRQASSDSDSFPSLSSSNPTYPVNQSENNLIIPEPENIEYEIFPKLINSITNSPSQGPIKYVEDSSIISSLSSPSKIKNNTSKSKKKLQDSFHGS